MPWEPISSSAIEAISYDPAEGVLSVKFVESGDVYEYAPVPVEVYENFLVAPSKGVFFFEHVRNAYPHLARPRG